MPALISEDGRWWWDGTQWRTRLVEGQPDLFWFTTTPDWTTRVLITGLIGLIPIVGAINMLGWALAAKDMFRNRWKELPPAGFQYLERGVAPFLVGLVYGVVFFIFIGMLTFLAVLLATSGGARALVHVFGSDAPIFVAIAVALLVLLIVVVWWLVWLYLFAALLIASDTLGIADALDPRRLFALARANHDLSMRVALIYGAASIAVVAIAVVLSFIPFAGLFVSIGLPALYAVLVPSLAAFRVEPKPKPGPLPV